MWIGVPTIRLSLAVGLLAAIADAASVRVGQEGPPISAAPLPAPAPAEDFDALLRAQPYFKKIVWRRDASFAPFEIVVQQPAVPEAGHDKAVVNFYGPWLVQLAKVFDETVATPAKLPPGLDPRPIRLVVLATEGDFVNFTKTVHTYDGYDSASFYDDRIRSVVTYWEMRGTASDRRYYALRRFVLALLHQRSTAPGGRQPPHWLREGLARLLAWHTGFEAATAFAKPTVDPRVYEILSEISQDAGARSRFLRPLLDLPAVGSYAELRKLATEAARASGKELSDRDPWHAGFMIQSGLWVEFLRREGAPEHNAAFEVYLRAAMAGEGSRADLEKAFAEPLSARLEPEFLQWVDARTRALDAGARVAARPAPSSKPGGARASDGKAGAPALAGAALAEKLALPADLRIERALAVRSAAAGHVDAALERLAAAAKRGGDDRDLAAVKLESERLAGWKAARDAWLGELVAAGGRLQVERDGKPVPRRVTALENGVVTIEWAQGKEQLAVSTFAPAALAGQMKSSPANTPEWARAYAYLLCGDARWDKALRDKSPESQALRADGRQTYERLHELGALASHLTALADSSDPQDEGAARSVLDRLWMLGHEAPSHPLVAERREALCALAAHAAALVHDAGKTKPVFSGATTWIDADTVEVLYQFDDASELADWTQTPNQTEGLDFKFDPVDVPEAKRGYGIREGSWAGRGFAQLTHTIPFEAPMNVALVLRHGTAESADDDFGQILLGICYGADTGFLAFTEGGHRYVTDLRRMSSVEFETSKLEGVPLGDPFPLEVAHDGEHARYQHGTTIEPDMPVGSLRSGRMFVLASTERDVLVDSIRIRGKLNAESRAKLREAWIAAEVRKTGLR